MVQSNKVCPVPSKPLVSVVPRPNSRGNRLNPAGQEQWSGPDGESSAQNKVFNEVITGAC